MPFENIFSDSLLSGQNDEKNLDASRYGPYGHVVSDSAFWPFKTLLDGLNFFLLSLFAI